MSRVNEKAGVAGVYNSATYLPERRRALEAWAQSFVKRGYPDSTATQFANFAHDVLSQT